MGCRVVIEAALQAPDRTAGVVLVDGSQFAPAMEATLRETFATPEGYAALVARWFEEMFTNRSDPAMVVSVVERAGRLPREIGEKVRSTWCATIPAALPHHLPACACR
jgi:pimeloyl-ACP methyl ester carboxylesterase